MFVSKTSENVIFNEKLSNECLENIRQVYKRLDEYKFKLQGNHEHFNTSGILLMECLNEIYRFYTLKKEINESKNLFSLLR